MYEVLERIKGIQRQVDELVGKQDEDAKESRESFKKIEHMQRQFQEVLPRRVSLLPVHHHVRRNSEPLPSKSKLPSPPKQRVVVNPSFPLKMPAPPSFEALTAPKQGGSRSSIASLSVGDIQRRLDGFERKLKSARKAMIRLEGKVVNMEAEAGTKNNQESMLKELTEIWSCVENIATGMLEKASAAGTPHESISEVPDSEDK